MDFRKFLKIHDLHLKGWGEAQLPVCCWFAVEEREELGRRPRGHGSVTGGVVGFPKSTNTPGVMATLSLPVYTAIGDPKTDISAQLQFLDKIIGFWAPSFTIFLSRGLRPPLTLPRGCRARAALFCGRLRRDGNGSGKHDRQRFALARCQFTDHSALGSLGITRYLALAMSAVSFPDL